MSIVNQSITGTEAKNSSAHSEPPSKSKQNDPVSYLNATEEVVYGFQNPKKMPPITNENVLEENENIINSLYFRLFNLCEYHFNYLGERIKELDFSDKEKALEIIAKLSSIFKEDFIKIYEYAKNENAFLWHIEKLPPEDLKKYNEFKAKKEDGYFQKEVDNEFESTANEYEDAWREYVKTKMQEEVEINILKRREYNREKGLFPERKIEEVRNAIFNFKKPDDSQLVSNMQSMKNALDIMYEKLKE